MEGVTFGVFVLLGGGVEALVPISTLADRAAAALHIDDRLTVRITEFDVQRRRW